MKRFILALWGILACAACAQAVTIVEHRPDRTGRWHWYELQPLESVAVFEREFADRKGWRWFKIDSDPATFNMAYNPSPTREETYARWWNGDNARLKAFRAEPFARYMPTKPFARYMQDTPPDPNWSVSVQYDWINRRSGFFAGNKVHRFENVAGIPWLDLDAWGLVGTPLDVSALYGGFALTADLKLADTATLMLGGFYAFGFNVTSIQNGEKPAAGFIIGVKTKTLL